MHIWSFVVVLGITLLQPAGGQAAEAIKLPPPVMTGGMPLVEALKVRRTVRHFASRPLDLGQISQLLWGADGTDRPPGTPDRAVRGGHVPPGPLPGGGGAGGGRSWPPGCTTTRWRTRP